MWLIVVYKCYKLSSIQCISIFVVALMITPISSWSAYLFTIDRFICLPALHDWIPLHLLLVSKEIEINVGIYRVVAGHYINSRSIHSRVPLNWFVVPTINPPSSPPLYAKWDFWMSPLDAGNIFNAHLVWTVSICRVCSGRAKEDTTMMYRGRPFLALG